MARWPALALLLLVPVAACVRVPDAAENLVATEVAIRVAVDATLTAQAAPPEEIAFESWRDGNWEIYLMLVDGSNQRNLTRHPSDDTHPAWSPDGQRLAFASNRETVGGLYSMAPDGSDVALLRAFDAPIDDLDWSPDGTHLAVTLCDGTPYAVWVIPRDGGQGVRLAEGAMRVRSPSWAPDGLRLAVQVANGGPYRLAVFDRDGGQPRFLPCEDAECTEPAWSPDGERIAWAERTYGDVGPRIAYAGPDGEPVQYLAHAPDLSVCSLSWDAEGNGLFAVVSDGSRCTRIERLDLATGDITAIGESGDVPTVSPDGLRIAVTAGSGQSAEIQTLSLVGHAPRRLTDNAVPDRRPAWRPRGDQSEGGTR